MFGLVVRFDLKDADAAAAYDALVAKTAPGIRDDEPGTLVYTTHTIDGEPLARVHYELYADRAAFEAHERAPHTVEYLRERQPYIAATRVEFLTPGPSKLPG
ncbi:MAG: antibiotic biosynthesis monooxygenase [Streptosporangiales bacterium]|nr:antibiotic biosynthesis monooxygenase [Streptosporangiales bacterium]